MTSLAIEHHCSLSCLQLEPNLVRFEHRTRGGSWFFSKLTWLFNVAVMAALVYFSFVNFADVSVKGSSVSVVPKVNFSKPQVSQNTECWKPDTGAIYRQLPALVPPKSPIVKSLLQKSPKSPRSLTKSNQNILSRAMFSMPYSCGRLLGPL